MSLLQPGRCRHCGCTGDSCRLPDGDLCGFTDRERLVCSGKTCQIAEADRKARAKAETSQRKRSEWAELKARGWGDGAIREELRKRARRKGRAA
jgi:hypothetical protein